MSLLNTDLSAKSTLINRNVIIHGRRTSVRLEPEMWSALFDIAAREEQSIHQICSLVSDRKKMETSLTAAIRVFVMAYYRAAATEDGHKGAGHGQFIMPWKNNLPQDNIDQRRQA